MPGRTKPALTQPSLLIEPAELNQLYAYGNLASSAPRPQELEAMEYQRTIQGIEAQFGLHDEKELLAMGHQLRRILAQTVRQASHAAAHSTLTPATDKEMRAAAEAAHHRQQRDRDLRDEHLSVEEISALTPRPNTPLPTHITPGYLLSQCAGMNVDFRELTETLTPRTTFQTLPADAREALEAVAQIENLWPKGDATLAATYSHLLHPHGVEPGQ